MFSQNNKKNRPFDEDFFYKDDDKVRFYTGLNSFEVLMKTFHFVAPHVKRRSMYVNKFQEFIMVLIKLRLNVPTLIWPIALKFPGQLLLGCLQHGYWLWTPVYLL